MKKILFLTYYYPPDLSAGSFRSKALISKIADQRKDYKIQVLTTSPNRYTSYSSSDLGNESNSSISIRRHEVRLKSKNFINQIISFIFFARFCIKETKNDHYDLVFATSSRLMTAFLGAFIASRKKTMLYLDIRDIFRDTIKDVFPNIIAGLLAPIILRIEKFTYNQATKINLVSAGFTEYFEKNFSYNKLSYFTNGIDKEFLKDSSFYSKNDFNHQSLKVVYAGNIGDGQALHKIIPVLAKKFPNIEFFIIGDGSRKYKLEKLIKLDNLDNVKIKPPISREKLIHYYQIADILLLNLDCVEAFKKVLPSKIFEYGSTFKPILAGVNGHAKVFCDSNIPNIKCFRPSDPNDAVIKIKQLELKLVDRENFCKQFSRDNIMIGMSCDVLNLIS